MTPDNSVKVDNLKRKEIPTQYPDIFKIVVFNPETGKWVEPTRGKKFKARRYDKKPDGAMERIKRSFDTLSEAKAFRLGAPTVDEKSECRVPPNWPQARPSNWDPRFLGALSA